MKILLTHRYFWPDSPPYAAMLRQIAEAVAAPRDGAAPTVSVFTSMPSYRAGVPAPRREQMGPFHVRRIWTFPEKTSGMLIRLINVVLYCGGMFRHILAARPDVVSASTFPPVVAAWTASLAAWLIGAKFVYHMQDVHPEVSQEANGAMGKGLLFRVMRWLDTRTLKSAAAIVVLSRDMEATVRARPGGADLPVHVINNFVMDDITTPGSPPADLVKTPGQVRVIFAGNLGRFQNLGLLADGIGLLFDAHPKLEVLFLGDGAALPDLKARWGAHPQVKFGPFLPFADAKELIRDADLGLVSLAPGIFRVSYPSKVLSYLGLGLPMLALVEPESALADDILSAGIGVVPAAPTPEAIADALKPVLSDPEHLARMRARARDHHRDQTAPDIVLARWQGLMAAFKG